MRCSGSPAAAKVADEHGRLVRGERDEQPARGLGVECERFLRRGGRALDVRAGVVAVAAVAARPDAGLGQLERGGEGRQRRGVELDPDAAARGHLVRMPEQPEAGHVGHRVRGERPQRIGGLAVERAHRRHGRVERPRRCSSLALRLEHETRAERLRQEEGVARLGAALRPDAVRVDGADDGEAVFRLVVADRVAAGEDRPGRADDLVRAGEDLAQHLGRQLLGEGRDREREQRHAAHREDIVERVRRRDRSEGPRVVDDRWEEVDGEDEGAVVVEPVHGRIVGGIEADEQIGRVDRDEAGEQLLEPCRRVLRGAATGFGKRGERRRFGHETSVRTCEGTSAGG